MPIVEVPSWYGYAESVAAEFPLGCFFYYLFYRDLFALKKTTIFLPYILQVQIIDNFQLSPIFAS